MVQKVAVILSGCGYQDGSDPNEVSPLCVALSRAGMTPVFYAPYITMAIGVNHANGVSAETNRNVLVESARLVRDPVHDLKDLNAEDEDIVALTIPGGDGILHNLSNFASSFESPEVQEDVLKAIRGFKSANKPIGCTSYASVLVALAIPEVEITLGADDEDECPNSSFVKCNLMERGTTVTPTGIEEICVDSENKIVTTSAFLYVNAKYYEVADAITQLVESLTTLLDA